ncbi:hypothetical protein FACS1894163_13610 [Spirochaetia bacterium]|nr:hypothetical protein FACS1894163_13610 [Spirochaetia bacterium]
MKTKISALLLGLLLVPLAGLAAQDNSFSILSFDIGYAPTYILGDVAPGSDKYVNVATFSLNVKVTDPIIVGFGTYTLGGGVLTTFNLKYQVVDKVRLGLSIGGMDGEAVSGVGLEFVPFSRKVQNTVATEFKLTAQYLFFPDTSGTGFGTSAGIDKGALFFGLAVGLGF